MSALIAVDARMAGMGGIGRYLESLLEAMLPISSGFDWVLVGNPDKLERLAALSRRVAIRKATTPIYSLGEWAWLGKSFEGADLVHAPHFNAPRVGKAKLVVTIHDLIHFDVPEYLPFPGAGWVLDHRLRSLLRKADGVIAVSGATRSELLARYSRILPDSKIRVIHEDASSRFAAAGQSGDAGRLAKLGVDNRYFLYVGAMREHKQPQHAVDAFRRFRAKRPDSSVQMVLCGALNARFERKHHFRQLMDSTPGVRWITGADDADLAALYRGAAALVMPSRIEGFGLPVIEAMRSGTPVIAADIPSLREVGGDAPVYYPAGQIDALSEALHSIFNDQDLRRFKSQSGLSRADQFSWSAAAAQTMDLYREVLSGQTT